jgi:CRISPR-associated exonuclease Cas4
MAEAEPIPLSALQHAVYCLRQAALIHLERLWADNQFTAQGDVLHAVADKGGKRLARGVRRVMALAVSSTRLGIAGVCDMVEFSGEVPFPVEYKRGKPKLHRADEVQLCAQALCLEEMTGHAVPQGALYYAETHRRVAVPFDSDLRGLTETVITDLRAVLTSGVTPPPTQHKSRCRACSLHDLCRPEVFARPILAWRSGMLRTILDASP